jgi:purine catabolism regulator
MITVRELIEQVLPEETQVVAGETGLGGEVTWATRPRPTPPAFGHLSHGELVLLGGKTLQNIDERLTLEGVIKQLAGFNVSAVAFAGRVTATAKATADAAGLPLLQLPADADLSHLERRAADLISEKRRDAQRRGHDSGRKLMELAISGESVPTLARTLAELADRPVLVETREGRILAAENPGGESMNRELLLPLLERGRPAVAAWLRSVATSSPAEPPTTTVELDNDRKRLIAPIIGRDGLLGLLSMFLPGKKETAEEAMLSSRGAAASAIVMTRDRAAQAARQELELNVLDEILDGALRSEVSLLEQAKKLQHDLQQPYVALVSRLDPVSNGTQIRTQAGRWSIFDEVLVRRSVKLMWRLRHNHAEIIWPAATPQQAREIAAQLFEELTRRLPEGSGYAVSLGVGSVRQGPAGIRQSHQEAKQALTMGRKLYGPGHLTRFEDLGVYRLLFAAQNLPELQAFHDEVLGPLVEYDKIHGAELIKTLGAFFDARCGPKEAAAILGVHRNTVLYRLERVKELTGLDLDDADVRLRLHLALYANSAVFSDEAAMSRR